MKTDRFSDIIRRKLESIRPEFTEKDWTRMQASLHQAMPPQPGSPVASHPFSGGVWSGSSWLLAAASVSTVVLIAFSLWQRSEINHLRETVGQLKQQPVTTQPTPALPTQDRPALTRIDSQNRSLPALGIGSAINAEPNSPGNRDTASSARYNALPNSPRQEATKERSIQQRDVPPKLRDAVASQTPVSTSDAHSQNTLNKNLKTDDYGVSSTPFPNNRIVSAPSVAASKSVNQSAPDRTELYADIKKKNRSQPLASGSANVADNRTSSATNKTGPPSDQASNPGQRPSETTTATQVSDNVASTSPSKPATDRREASETYKLATSLPLSLPDRDWNTALVRRAKRMRSVQPSVAVPDALPASVAKAKAPDSQPVAPLVAGFRAGVGTEFTAHTWSAGVFSEIQLSNHWALGVGLNKAMYLGGLFITAFDFDNRTHRDFQKEIGRDLNPKLDPKGDILNIDTRVQRFQLPLSLSYRLPLSRTLTLLPTVGTYLNLSSTEKVTFYFRDSPRGFDQAYFNESHPVKLLNTFALSTALEWQSRHWVVQGSPLLTVPLTPDPDWQKGSILGFRTRVMYQF